MQGAASVRVWQPSSSKLTSRLQWYRCQQRPHLRGQQPDGRADERGSAGVSWPPGARPLARWAAHITSTTTKATAC
ncbi:MAG TPA: hypothetical protein VKX46_17565 [Ktedonobacteraceae bacterium]|nr:hypothetical protein [Ktedonobacteraceae bacterium]